MIIPYSKSDKKFFKTKNDVEDQKVAMPNALGQAMIAQVNNNYFWFGNK